MSSTDEARVLAELLIGNALGWCATRRLVRPADLACSRCGSVTEGITLRADQARRPT
jgi:hypothetical protein